MRLPGIPLTTLIVRLPRCQTFYNVKAPALLAPYVVNLHGCFPLCSQVQVLLGQMCSQLSDLKLKVVGEYPYLQRIQKEKQRGSEVLMMGSKIII